MGEKKKIEIADAPDDENIDLKADVSEETQDVWAEKLDEVESETEENVDPESEDVEQDSASDTEAANEDVSEETVEETSQDEESQPESDPEDDDTTLDDDEADENVDESEHESKVSSDDVESEGSDNPEPEQQDEKPETADDAVDEIVREESNAVLKAEDEARQRFNAPPEKKSLKNNLRHFFAVWWKNKHYRYGTLVGLFVALLVAVFVPYTRYGMLNLAGVRVSSSMVVVDSVTGIPLKNIPVQLQGKEARSDDDGKVSFTDLRLGRTQLKVDKRGYAQFEKYITLGWGSNPIGEQGITATGAQFKFVLTDWLTGKPVTDAEATSGEDVGQSDDEGRITLTVGEDGEDAEVVLSAKDYREERLKLSDINQEETAVKMVAAKKHAFVSNRNGNYDLYAIDADGKNEKILLAATSKEREVPFVLPSQDRNVVAYISSRDGDVNKSNFILDGLFIVDTDNGDTYKVTRSEQLQLIGWSGNKLIYVAVIEGVSAGNSQRSKLISFDLDSRERTDLAAANYFNDVKLVGDTVYYSISSYAVPASQAKLFSIKPDGTEKNTVVNTQVWSIIRKDFDTLLFNAIDLQWFEQVGDGEPKKLDVEPAQKVPRIYSVSPDGMNALWVDVRDGKGVLLNYQTEPKKEDVLVTEAGLGDPVYWLDNTHFVYRVSTTQETADYVMSIDGGESQKLADVVGNRSRYFY